MRQATPLSGATTIRRSSCVDASPSSLFYWPSSSQQYEFYEFVYGTCGDFRRPDLPTTLRHRAPYSLLPTPRPSYFLCNLFATFLLVRRLVAPGLQRSSLSTLGDSQGDDVDFQGDDATAASCHRRIQKMATSI